MSFEEIFGRMLIATGLRQPPKPRERVAKAEKPASMQVQTLIFDKDGFDAEKAKKWTEDHKFKASKVDETGSSFRVRQLNPGRFKTMRTITLTDGVKAVVGKDDPGSSDVHVDSTDWSGPKRRKKPAPSKMMIEKQGGGIMVALYVPAEFAKKLVLQDGEKPEDMHITLVYIPGVGEDQAMFDKVATAAKTVADRFDAIEITVDGMSKFTASMQTDWKDVFYACASAPDLMILQDQVSKALAFAGVEVSRKHSFVPHITLKYAEPGTEMPDKELKGSFHVSQLSVASKTIAAKHFNFDALLPPEAKPHPLMIQKQDELSPEQLRAKAADLIVLPDDVEGTNCSNCKYFGYDDSSDTAVCSNPEVDQPVDDRMCCALWDADGAERVWELQGLEKSYDQQCDPDFDEDCEDVDKLLKGYGLERQKPSEDVRMAMAALSAVGAPAGKPKRLAEDNTGATSIEMALKALDGVTPNFVPIFKADKAKQIVHGVVLEPDTVDAQEDVMSADDIEEAAHKYLVESRTVGSGHTKTIKAVPVESYIAPVDFQGDGQYGNQIVKKGSWVLGVKVLDPKEWAKVENGEYTGFSVGGVGERSPL